MAKKLKLKVPKRIAGVKIPKSVRKGAVAQFINSSSGQMVIAEALVVLGGAFAARRSDSLLGDFMRHPLHSGAELGHTARARSRRASATIGDETERLSHAMREAIHAFRRAMDDRRDAEDERVAESSVEGNGDRGKKNGPPTSSAHEETQSTPH